MSVQEISAWLRLFIAPEQVTELRALHVGGSTTVSGYYDYAHLDEMARLALELTEQAEGVYFVPNPIRPELLERSPNRANGSIEATKDADVVERRWLLIDFDPVRPARVSATDAEKQVAFQRAVECRQSVQKRWGPLSTIFADSGNGYHLCVAVQLPNDEATKEACQARLKMLVEEFSDEKVKVDTAVYNAARIWKLYGTWSRKGESSAERPHRQSKVLEYSDELASREP